MHACERAIAELAGRQDNLVTREQLLAIGLGRGAIAHRLAAGRWRRVHPGVYLVAPAPLQLTRAGARGAARVRRRRDREPHDRGRPLGAFLPGTDDVHVTVPGRHTGPREGVRVHRTAALDPDETRAQARPATDVARADDLRPRGNGEHSARPRPHSPKRAFSGSSPTASCTR